MSRKGSVVKRMRSSLSGEERRRRERERKAFGGWIIDRCLLRRRSETRVRMGGDSRESKLPTY